jgi:hypothetical protein
MVVAPISMERQKMVDIATEEGWIETAIENGREAGLSDPVAFLVIKDRMSMLPPHLFGDAGKKIAEKYFTVQRRIGSPEFVVLAIEFELLMKIYGDKPVLQEELKRTPGPITLVIDSVGCNVCML